MPEPLKLTARSAPDLAQQQHYHRVTALAVALHQSHTVIPLRAQQPVPHATPRTNAAGSAEAARLETLKAELETRHWRLSRARNVGSVADILAADTRITELEGRIERVGRELGEIDTRKSAPAGLPYLYSIRVPPLAVSGYLEATYAGERWELDTRGLPEELRGRLGAYLLGGREALPYKYKRTRGRYWPNSDAREEDRALMIALWGHAQQQINVSPPKQSQQTAGDTPVDPAPVA